MSACKNKPKRGQAGSDFRPTTSTRQKPSSRYERRSSNDRRMRPYARSSRYSRSPSPLNTSSRQTSVRNDEYPLPRRFGSSVPTCQLIVLGDVDRTYLSAVENSLRKSQIHLDTLYLNPKLNLGSVVEQLKNEGVRAILFLNKQLERSGRVALQHFKVNGQVQGKL